MALTHVMGPKLTPQYNRRAKNESSSPSSNLTPQRAITLGTAHSAHLRWDHQVLAKQFSHCRKHSKETIGKKQKESQNTQGTAHSEHMTSRCSDNSGRCSSSFSSQVGVTLCNKTTNPSRTVQPNQAKTKAQSNPTHRSTTQSTQENSHIHCLLQILMELLRSVNRPYEL